MENYIMLNGKRIDLTAEQIETLMGKKVKDPFKRVKGGKYFYIDSDGKIEVEWDEMTELDNDRYLIGNYCTDRELMEQRALHETLNRLLWRYSMQHGGGEIEWGNCNEDKYSIYANHVVGAYDVSAAQFCAGEGTIHFHTKQLANAAIEEIVKPFMEKHPEFRW